MNFELIPSIEVELLSLARNENIANLIKMEVSNMMAEVPAA